jgi:hypothetical protein
MDNIDPAYAQGLFNAAAQRTSTFPVIVRFSNGKGAGFVPGGPTSPDSSPDVRGFAVKVFGVVGAKGVQSDAETVDFLAVTSETNFITTNDDANDFFTATFKNSTLALAAWAATHPISAGRLGFFAATGNGYDLTQVSSDAMCVS